MLVKHFLEVEILELVVDLDVIHEVFFFLEIVALDGRESVDSPKDLGRTEEVVVDFGLLVRAKVLRGRSEIQLFKFDIRSA